MGKHEAELLVMIAFELLNCLILYVLNIIPVCSQLLACKYLRLAGRLLSSIVPNDGRCVPSS